MMITLFHDLLVKTNCDKSKGFGIYDILCARIMMLLVIWFGIYNTNKILYVLDRLKGDTSKVKNDGLSSLMLLQVGSLDTFLKFKISFSMLFMLILIA